MAESLARVKEVLSSAFPGIRFTSDVRSQAEQDALVARGATRARNSQHVDGTGLDAVLPDGVSTAAVRETLRSAGINPTEFLNETGKGRNQGTGAHLHIGWGEKNGSAAPPRASSRPKSTADLYSAYKGLGGDITPEERAQFEADVQSGKVRLPEGVSLDSPTPGAAKPGAVPIPLKTVALYNQHSDMTDAQRDMIDRDVERGHLTLDKGVALKRPAPRSMGDRLMAGADSVIQGLATVEDLVATPIRAPVNAVLGAAGLPTIPTISQTSRQAGAEMGVPQPTTPGEKIIDQTIQGASGGALTFGVGGVAAPASGLLGTVGKALASSPVDEVAAGAAGGGASEVARQADLGPVGQFGAALVGGLGAVGATRGGKALIEKFGEQTARAIETTPRAVLIDETGELTEEGVEAAVRAKVAPEEFQAAVKEADGLRTPQEAPGADPATKVADDVTEGAPAPAVAARQAPGSAAVASARPTGTISQEIPLTRGEETKDFGVYARERQLAGMDSPEGIEARAWFSRRDDAIESAVTKYRATIDDPTLTAADRGTLIRDGLTEMKDQGRAGVTALYREGRELAERARGELGHNAAAMLDLDTAEIKSTLRELLIDHSIPEPTRDGLRQIAAQYGLIGNGKVKTYEDGTTVVEIPEIGGTGVKTIPIPRLVEKLSLTNGEEFRQALNRLYKPGDPATGRPLALGNLADAATAAAIERVAVEGLGEFGDIARAARKAHQTQKQTFEGKDAVQRVIDFKKGTQTPQVADDRVARTLLNSAADLKKAKAVLLLSSPTEKSRAAWRALQAQGVGEIFEKAFVVNARGGEGAISGAKLNTAINKFTPEKLKILLDPSEYDELMALRRRIGDATITLPNSVSSSGSDLGVIRFLTKQAAALRPVARVIPGAGMVLNMADGASALAKMGRDATEAKETLKGITGAGQKAP